MKLPTGFEIIGPKPYPFQKVTILYGIKKNNCGLLLEMGLGKTRCAIDIARYRIQFEELKKILVVTPTSIMYNWQQELRKYSNHGSVVLHGERIQRIARIRAFDNVEDCYFGIINYEALHRFYSELKKLDLGMIIFDESARYIKNHLAKRTKTAIALADSVTNKILLTGTPIANKPLDIWSQFRVMDGGKTFGVNYYSFRNRNFYKIKKGQWSQFIIKKENIKTIQKCIYNSCIRFRKEDVLKDLPSQLYHTIELPLSGELKRIYNIVKEKVLAEIDTESGTKKLEITNILVKLLRLQTVTSGFIKDNNGQISRLRYTPKLDALTEEVESIVDAEEHVVIWVKFLHTIEMIESELKKRRIPVITMSGRDKDKFAKWKGFQKSKTKHVFVAQIESGGIGIELFKLDSSKLNTQHMIFYENVYSLDVRLQASDRIHRIGQKSACRYVDIVVKDTIDERILEIIQDNKKVADLIIERGVKGWLK